MNIQSTLDEKTPRGYISKYYRFKVLKRQGWKCRNCGIKLKYSSKQDVNGKVAQIDHIVPLSKGGDDGSDNYQALCPNLFVYTNGPAPSHLLLVWYW